MKEPNEIGDGRVAAASHFFETHIAVLQQLQLGWTAAERRARRRLFQRRQRVRHIRFQVLSITVQIGTWTVTL